MSQRMEALEREKMDRDAVIQLLLRKVDRRQNDQFLHLLVNDFDGAKAALNKQFGSIRIKPNVTAMTSSARS